LAPASSLTGFRLTITAVSLVHDHYRAK
jgi:hypothetical protein